MCGKIKHVVPKLRNKEPEYQEQCRALLKKYFKEQDNIGITRKMVARKHGIKVGTIYGWLRRGMTGGPTLGHHSEFLANVIYPEFSEQARQALAKGIPSLLKEFRKSKNLTLKQVAKLHKVSLNTVWHWENGDKGSPSLAKHYPLVHEFLWWVIMEQLRKDYAPKKTGAKLRRHGARQPPKGHD